jgi:hypothetical protein
VAWRNQNAGSAGSTGATGATGSTGATGATRATGATGDATDWINWCDWSNWRDWINWINWSNRHGLDQLGATGASGLTGSMGSTGVTKAAGATAKEEATAVVASLDHSFRVRGGAVCAPHEFVNGCSTVASVQRICDILLRAPAVRGAYRHDAFVAAKACARIATDQVAQIAVDHMEATQLKYSLDPIVRAFELVAAEPGVADACLFLENELYKSDLSAEERVRVYDAINDMPAERLQQVPYLMECSLKFLSTLNRNVTLLSDKKRMQEIHKLRVRYRTLYAHVPLHQFAAPSSLVSLGKWNCVGPSGAHWKVYWPCAAFQRALQQNLMRRAKQQKFCRDEMLALLAAGERVPKDVEGGLLMVTIQNKQISEIRSTKQAPLLGALFSCERLDTVAPSKSNFPHLITDFPWKLRSFCGNVNFVSQRNAQQRRKILIQRDFSASFGLSWLSLWERYAFEENLFYELVLRNKKRILSRPAAYLFHTDYEKWKARQLKVHAISRF